MDRLINILCVIVGYLILFFWTVLFVLAALMGKQSAAVQCLIVCTLMLYLLPPR